ncbi:hypothetical protein [Halobacillus seohaensis]|uniref:HNH endonuclease n=1 Tax=Halobacillus seohaensis TaxID=447421 RepID=A0ABW2EIT6_9BACI
MIETKCAFCNKDTDKLKLVPITKDQRLWAELCLDCREFYSWLLEVES